MILSCSRTPCRYSSWMRVVNFSTRGAGSSSSSTHSTLQNCGTTQAPWWTSRSGIVPHTWLIRHSDHGSAFSGAQVHVPCPAARVATSGVCRALPACQSHGVTRTRAGLHFAALYPCTGRARELKSMGMVQEYTCSTDGAREHSLSPFPPFSLMRRS